MKSYHWLMLGILAIVVVSGCTQTGQITTDTSQDCEKTLVEEEFLSSYTDCRDFCFWGWYEEEIDGYVIQADDVSYDFELYSTGYGQCECFVMICPA